MFKKDARFHYGIKKHVPGDGYKYDGWVLDDNYIPLKYIYKASAEYMSDELNKAHSGRFKFYVKRYD